MDDKQKYIHLKLKQARRAERPYTLVKLLVLAGFFGAMCGVISNCNDRNRLTPAEQKKVVTDIWGGDADAHKKRLP